MEATKCDYLIVGGGLAGLFFAHELEQAGKSFLMIDTANEHAASNLAAGMFGPLGGKLHKLAWKAPEMLEKLAQKANELETKLGQKFIHWMPVQVAFGNTKDANDYASRELSPTLNAHLSDVMDAELHVRAPFACFEMLKGGWFNTSLFLKTYHQYLTGIGNYIKEPLNYSDLGQSENAWHYQDKVFNKVVFAEGHSAQNNPFVKAYLPFKLCKGQVLTIHCKDLSQNKIVKKGVYLVPLGDGLFKAGATYEWDDLTEIPTEIGLNLLLQKIKNLIDLPFEVLDQQAGIRPTTNDRNPIIGKIKSHENMFVLNGLGTKGVVRAPWLAETLLNFIEKGEVIPHEVSVERIQLKN